MNPKEKSLKSILAEFDNKFPNEIKAFLKQAIKTAFEEVLIEEVDNRPEITEWLVGWNKDKADAYNAAVQAQREKMDKFLE